ncbi:hypothetical protein P153DRAFT_435043 [Dothidotthia symphoricarpi CBS 119687]|uniref:Uncharacterized protein n=1 Tax=Dothidotthia symphoricarpi CBS 119687 TaxID=1392245 RepID=A0A6A5ZZ31_9PLEO|nr:uncharacterized protein P153DRAFT_435043 [Dothidotthia symphoricarpi CBS 119687]KAF2124830.1 hypothetical protein P153DRAFT_435043 [Dothidotthia symphoricarpi CBS 119687]
MVGVGLRMVPRADARKTPRARVEWGVRECWGSSEMTTEEGGCELRLQTSLIGSVKSKKEAVTRHIGELAANTPTGRWSSRSEARPCCSYRSFDFRKGHGGASDVQATVTDRPWWICICICHCWAHEGLLQGCIASVGVGGDWFTTCGLVWAGLQDHNTALLCSMRRSRRLRLTRLHGGQMSPCCWARRRLPLPQMDDTPAWAESRRAAGPQRARVRQVAASSSGLSTWSQGCFMLAERRMASEPLRRYCTVVVAALETDDVLRRRWPESSGVSISSQSGPLISDAGSRRRRQGFYAWLIAMNPTASLGSPALDGAPFRIAVTQCGSSSSTHLDDASQSISFCHPFC